MRILMLGWELPPHNSGGLGVACFELSRALANRGSSIDFVLPYRAQHPEAHFMKIHAATDLSPLHHYGFGAYDLYQEKCGNVMHVADHSLRDIQRRYTKYIEQHLGRDSGYDAIHAHDWLTMEAGARAKQLTGLPLIVHVHATEFDRAGGQAGSSLVHDIEYDGLMMADRIIAVSQYTKNLIIQKYQIPADKIEVIHNAVNVDTLLAYDYDHRTYRYLEAMKQQGYTVVATVTRFTIQKGLVQLVRAAARAAEKHDRILFLFAGDGEQRDELLQLSAELGISDKVFFTGFVRGQQWRDAFRVADIFVMSSVSEPFGITALEAAHYGDAVVVTKQSGVNEVLQSVLHYDYWDIDALADKLVAMAVSPTLRMTLTENVRSEYARLSWDTVAHKCTELYLQLTRKEVPA